MDATPTQILASLRLGRNVTEWASERRSATPRPSFRKIATELREITGGQVDVTDETIRNWLRPEPVEQAS